MAIFKNKKPATPPRRSPSAQPKSTVFSYYSNRSTPEAAPKRRPGVKSAANRPLPLWQFIPSLLAMAAVLASLLYSLTLQTAPRLSHSTVQANSLLQDDQVYRDALEKLLKGSIFNRSKLLINAPALEKQLEEQFPELASATITIPLTSRRPILAIEPIVPVMVLKTPTGGFVLDTNGKTVLEAGSGRDEILSKLPQVQDDSGLQIRLGETALSRSDTQFIREITHQLTEKQLVIESMTLPTAANELHVRLTGEGYYIKFNTQGDARLQAGTYLALKNRLGAAKPAEYIDVRVEEKAFYK